MKTNFLDHRTGLCLWFTGLPCSGKTTIARELCKEFTDEGRAVTFLDGDVVRTHLSKGLGFTREDREANLLRIGFVAAEVVKHQGIVICSVISPYEKTREEVRSMIGDKKFILIYVNTPIEICEKRDVKGMYAKARKGEIQHFTGVDDPYEPPLHPDIVLDTSALTLEESVKKILKIFTSVSPK
jgi:sulfate adenylyltransferase